MSKEVHEDVLVPIDMSKHDEMVKEKKEASKDTSFLEIDLKDYPVLKPQEHQFINTMLQISNQLLGLKQQYQQQIAAYKDISEIIKDMRAGRIKEIYESKGGMFLVKKKIEKDFIKGLMSRRNEIINANNMTVGQLQKNYEIFQQYRKKVALQMSHFLEDKSKREEIIALEKEIDNEAKSILTGMEL